MAKRNQTVSLSPRRRSYNKSDKRVRSPSNSYWVKVMSSLGGTATELFWAMYNTIEENYVVVISILVIVLLGFLLPDISHKIQVSSDMKTMRKVVDMVTTHVERAEVACLTTADEICCLQTPKHDENTETTPDMRDLSICTSSTLHSTHSEPVQVEKKIGFLRRFFFPYKNASHKEIAIMSYVYTHSFDAKKPVNATNNIPEVL